MLTSTTTTTTTAELGRCKPYDKDLHWRTEFEHAGRVGLKSADKNATKSYDEHQELLIIGMFMQEP